MQDLFMPAYSPETSDRYARTWVSQIDPKAAVGTRHHIVPRFLLTRFANQDERILVRDRTTGSASVRSIGDLAVRDFYTAVTDEGGLDSSMETLLSAVEGAAAQVLRTHLERNVFTRSRALSDEERFKIDTFVSMQYVRGMGTRRGIEIMTDYGMKLLHGHLLSPEEIDELDFVPHPNEHLRMLPRLAERAHEELLNRPLGIVTIDQPLFIVGDEPAALLKDGRRDIAEPNGLANASVTGIDPRDIVQFQGRRGIGLLAADEIVLAVSPTTALVYGPGGTRFEDHAWRLSGRDAAKAAKKHAAAVLDTAVDWVAAHPNHPTFARMRMPATERIVTIADGGTGMGRHANGTDARRPINRVRAEDVEKARQYKIWLEENAP